MAKRYHQSMKDKRDERLGELHHERMERMHEREHYSGMGARRRQELEDAGMIREDHSAIANLPQEVRIREYPKAGNYLPEGLDDTIRGVDRQMGDDDSQRARHNRPHKY